MNTPLALIEETILDNIKQINNDLYFSFYSDDDTEQELQLICKNVSNITCTESCHKDQTTNLDYLELSDLDCLQVQLRGGNINMLFQGDEVVINLNFNSEEFEMKEI